MVFASRLTIVPYYNCSAQCWRLVILAPTGLRIPEPMLLAFLLGIITANVAVELLQQL